MMTQHQLQHLHLHQRKAVLQGGRGRANGWGREQGTAAVMWVLLLMAHVHKFMITYDTKRMMKRLKGIANRRRHMQQASVQQNSSHF